MTKSKFRTVSIFILIILEGYIVLSSEMLVIRQIMPYVGNGTDTLSIVIAAVLMPLAFGYKTGGQFKPGWQSNGKYLSVRQKLLNNMWISLIILSFGLSYIFISLFFIPL